MTWTINGTPASSIGINGLTLTASNQSAGTFSFVIPGDFAASTPYPYKSELKLSRGSECWFRGVVVTIPRTGTTQRETVSICAQDSWWWLENIVFEQDWSVYEDDAVVSISKGRCILGLDAAGNRQTNGDVIREALQYAIDSGAPIAIGSIDLATQIPADEVKDVTCAEVIRAMMRWAPDAVAWWSYSGTTPVFNCRYRRNLSAVSANIQQGAPHKDIEIAARSDLLVPSVIIKYESSHTSDSNSYSSITVDKYPTSASGREPGALVGTVSLEGSYAAHLYQDVQVSPIQTDDLDWWKNHFPWMDSSDFDSLRIYDITRSGAQVPTFEFKGEITYKTVTGLPSELTDGQLTDWMQEQAGAETIRAKVSYSRTDESGLQECVDGQEISVNLTSTDATSRRYWKLSAFTPAEQIPEGLAEALYTSSSELQYEGSFTMVQDEPTGTLSIGRVLNLSGGLSDWSSMRALIQSVSVNIDKGETRVTFGPAQHLGFADLVELLRCTRNLTPAYQAALRQDADLSGSSSVIPGALTPPRGNSTQGPPRYTRLLISSGNKTVDIDPDATLTEIDVLVGQPYVVGDGGPLRFRKRTIKCYGSIPFEIGPETDGPEVPGGTCDYAG